MRRMVMHTALRDVRSGELLVLQADMIDETMDYLHRLLAVNGAGHEIDLAQAIESLSTKVGLVLLVLGAMHFFNLYVFSRLRRRALLRSQKPPVLPEQFVEPVQAWNH